MLTVKPLIPIHLDGKVHTPDEGEFEWPDRPGMAESAWTLASQGALEIVSESHAEVPVAEAPKKGKKGE